MENGKLKIAITQGDVNGISYEVILKALSEPDVYGQHAVVVYGSSKVAAYYRKNFDLSLNFIQVASAKEAAYGSVSIVNCCDDDIKVETGQSTAAAGKASYEALEAAVSDLKSGLVDVLVTGPINKHNIQSPEFNFPGHTEYLEQVFGADASASGSALMLMVSESMRIAVATTHIPLEQVTPSLTEKSVLLKIKALNQSLRRDFGIAKPRIAVLSLNPHGGDNGLLGKQEQAILQPAIEAAQQENILCFGPIPADGFFGTDKYTLYDGVLAMYHDQGMIPFKALAQGHGVNFTAGLPIVRTSPAHGTAYDLAGQNLADETSMREAIYLACDIYRNRLEYKEIHKNPLRKQHIEQSGDLADLPPVQEEGL